MTADVERLTAISLGAGVQSTTLALMAARGEIEPMPDCAIFADTQSEPRAVYDHLAWLRSPNVLPFPVHVVTAGSLRDDMLRGTNSGGEKRFAAIPYFLDQDNGHFGMGQRQCTSEYKIAPIGWKLRQMLGVDRRAPIPPGTVEVWIGITTDEAHRMKASRVAWRTNRWPLIEARMSRADCIAWLTRHDYPTPPKSACSFCPYRSDEQWIRMKATDPAAWAESVAVDEAIRQRHLRLALHATPYLHRSRQPLAEVDFRSWAERGQSDLFGEECEGMCGV
jgi:hypothetical protein